jgi:hypothetical protein
MASETYAYKTLDPTQFIDKADSVHVVEISTPIKTQDGIGFCYGFSSTSLLETYRCTELKLDCSKPENFLSAFDVTSHYKNNALEEGGQSSKIMDHIAHSNRKIAAEECARFSTLVHKVTENKKTVIKNEGKAWDYLSEVWNNYKSADKSKQNCISCLADSIKNRLGNIKTPAGQIEDAFKTATTLEKFLYKTILPVECLAEEKMLSIPEFAPHTYPLLQDKFDEDVLTNKIISLLNSGIPLEIGICADKKYSPNCDDREGHSIALYGIKEACNKKTGECRKLVKVKNSYGMGWQKKFNDGWVDMETIVKSSASFATFDNITWIQKPE